MAQPMRSHEHARATPPPPRDPTAVQRAYRRERAKRRHRQDRIYERRLAALRFTAVMVGLLALGGFLAMTVWQEIQRLFGL
jgi:hypothetical protein